MTALLAIATAAPATAASVGDFWTVAPAYALLGGVLLLGYIKLGVVLAVLRSGLGGVLPASLTALLALLLSVFAMAPLYERCHQAMDSAPAEAPAEARLQAGLGPLREFLLLHTPAAEQTAVKELSLRIDPRPRPQTAAKIEPANTPMPALLVAFALSELRAAFQLGFVLLLPFLLIDLLCASLLGGLLLPGLSARAVALPFKLLLFVLCDGWQLLSRGLLTAYGAMSGGGP